MLVEMTGAASMQPCFASTAGVRPRERFDYWHDVVCRNLVDLEYQLIGEGQFDATFHATPMSALQLCRIQASPHSATRSGAGISRTGSESVVFNFVLSGSLIAEQDGRVARLKVGDGALCDADRPYKLHQDQPFEIACIRIPRRSLASRVGSAGLKVSQNFAELLIAMVAEFAEAASLPLSEYRGLALMRVKDAIERNLGRTDLAPATIAAELKLSPRYINQLLEAEGTSLSRYIWGRRLERAAEQLRDSNLRGRSVSQIAMDNGFNDLSHFSKAFRGRFAQAPRDYRNTPQT
jgi:AraC family transcriptional activator of tynA and feaB